MRSIIRRAGALLALVAVAACSKTTGGGIGDRVNGFTIPHVLRYSGAEDINTLNPWFGQQITMFTMAQMTMAWLIRFDERNRPMPELVTQVPTKANGGVSKDGLTIVYHLRKGVKWSDGAPFDADDVVFSFKQYLNPANNVLNRTGWDLIRGIDEPDKYTVVLHLKSPYSPFVETFFSTGGSNPCVIPKHLLARYSNINNVPYNSLPVGIGPFKFERWDRAQDVVMVANPLYWRGAPKLQKVIYQIIPDRNTVLAQLQAKTLDLWFPVTGAYVQQAKALDGYTLIAHPGYQYDHIDFNVTHPVVADAVVRRALRMAIDRPERVATIMHGNGVVTDSVAPPSSPYADPNIPLVPFDLAKANRMLDDDGWKLGADGVRAKNGVRLALNLATTTGSPDGDRTIELIRQWWKQIGVSLRVRHYPVNLFFESNAQGGVVYSDKWDAIIFAWQSDALGDNSSLYSCKNIPQQNNLRWCNPTAQAAYDRFYDDYDQAERNRDEATILRQLFNDAPTIVLDVRNDTFAVNKDLKGFHPNEVSPFDNMMDVDI